MCSRQALQAEMAAWLGDTFFEYSCYISDLG